MDAAVEDYSQVDILSSRYKPVNLRGGKSLEDAGYLDAAVEDLAVVAVLHTQHLLALS